MAVTIGVYDGRRHGLQIDVYDPDDNIDTCRTAVGIRVPATDGSGRRQRRGIAVTRTPVCIKFRRYRSNSFRTWQRHAVFALQQILPFVL